MVKHCSQNLFYTLLFIVYEKIICLTVILDYLKTYSKQYLILQNINRLQIVKHRMRIFCFIAANA